MTGGMQRDRGGQGGQGGVGCVCRGGGGINERRLGDGGRGIEGTYCVGRDSAVDGLELFNFKFTVYCVSL